jgi:hypothetical protein
MSGNVWEIMGNLRGFEGFKVVVKLKSEEFHGSTYSISTRPPTGPCAPYFFS